MSKIKSIVCILFGHSKIQSYCFGYFNCGRCDEQVGDSLGGAYSPKGIVIVDHNCTECKENYKQLNWKDKILVKNPFEVNNEEV